MCRTPLAYRIVSVILLSLVGPGGVRAAEVRTWTDGSGSFSVEAQFVRLEGAKVVLEREDGKTVRIDLVKLSAADQHYVMLALARGYTSSQDDPLDSPQRPAPGLPIVSTDWSGVRTLTLQPRGSWKLPVAEAASTPTTKPMPIVLPKKRDFWDCFLGRRL